MLSEQENLAKIGNKCRIVRKIKTSFYFERFWNQVLFHFWFFFWLVFLFVSGRHKSAIKMGKNKKRKNKSKNRKLSKIFVNLFSNRNLKLLTKILILWSSKFEQKIVAILIFLKSCSQNEPQIIRRRIELNEGIMVMGIKNDGKPSEDGNFIFLIRLS